jgi:hypothetical protein
MGNQGFDEFVRTLRDRSSKYATRATLLSQSLEAAESFLQQIPGKIEVSVGEGWNKLEFMKRSSLGWKLWYGDDQEGCFVTNASVEIKAEAAKLLPKLLEVLVESITGKLEAVDAGLESLKKIPFLEIEGADQHDE